MQPANKALGFAMGFKYSIAASQLFDFTARRHCSPINGLKFEKGGPPPPPAPPGGMGTSTGRVGTRMYTLPPRSPKSDC
jgi:hypothetical protein